VITSDPLDLRRPVPNCASLQCEPAGHAVSNSPFRDRIPSAHRFTLWLDTSSEMETGVMAVQLDGVLPNREQCIRHVLPVQCRFAGGDNGRKFFHPIKSGLPSTPTPKSRHPVW